MAAVAGALEDEPGCQVDDGHDDDGDGDPEYVAVAQDSEIEFVRHDRLAIGHRVAQPAQKRHRAEGDNERGEREIRRQPTVHQAGECTGGEAEDNRPQRIEPVHGREHRDDAGHRDDRPDG
jgi:hypothetical protein